MKVELDRVPLRDSTLSPEEILCMINVLRMELIKDGWTTRYLDMGPPYAGGIGGASGEAGAEDQAPPDNSIRIIADCTKIFCTGYSESHCNGQL